MLGRNIREEHGRPGGISSSNSMSSAENDLMGQATRCVRKFAPEGKKKMRRLDSGHITACKISDANPNEMIASWSGDHIYSFDLIRSPDASEHKAQGSSAFTKGAGNGKARESGDRKRKRTKTGSLSQESGRRGSKPRHHGAASREASDMALRVRYDNGQSEDISMSNVARSLPEQDLESARNAVLTESQKRSARIAKSMVKIRKMLFSLEASHGSTRSTTDLASHRTSFTSTLGLAASILPEMDEISRSWRYPVNPLQEDIMLQSTLRGNRDSSRRFIQAAGTLARVLGGHLQTAGSTPSPALDLFQDISPASNEGPPQSTWELFRYDFLRAILLWLEGGRAAILEGFKRSPNQRRNHPRFPLPQDATEDEIDSVIIPRLLKLAKDTDTPISNIDASRFERDETRRIFSSEAAAVIAFAAVIKTPIEDLSRAIMPASASQDDSSIPDVQDRKTALLRWGFQIGRGLLMNAAEGVNFQYVDTAFGGLGDEELDEGRRQEDIDPDEEEEIVEHVTLVQKSKSRHDSGVSSARGDESAELEANEAFAAGNTASAQVQDSDVEFEDADSNTDAVLMEDFHDEIADRMADEDADQDRADSDDEDADSTLEDDNDGDITAEERLFMFRSASDRGKIRESVERRVPCDNHTKQYSGHCNVKTVKDANFFGLQDDYVVSGSDGGHVFIWDRKTSEVVNILEGDSEVVNVIQG